MQTLIPLTFAQIVTYLLGRGERQIRGARVGCKEGTKRLDRGRVQVGGRGLLTKISFCKGACNGLSLGLFVTSNRKRDTNNLH